MKQRIYIDYYASISTLGKVCSGSPLLFEQMNIVNYDLFYQKQLKCPVARINQDFLVNKKKYSKYLERTDRIVDLVLTLADDLKGDNLNRLGIFIGSSRAATGLFENSYNDFMKQERLYASTSPLTTHANVASTLASVLSKEAVCIEHSVTCSSGMFSILDAIAWLKSEMIDSAIAGGVEAPITDFTLAQMLALKIYTPYDTYPFSRPFELYPNHNSFVLGEGAGLFRLGTQRLKSGNNQFEIIAYGVGYENAESLVAISKNGDALAKAMQSAVKQAGVMPDLICAHAPGTILGDQSESRAIKTIFSDNLPYVFSTKFLFGHTLGSSGALSLAYACKLLETQKIIPFPYQSIWGEQIVPKDIKTILVNATGFGGTAVSLMISRVQD